MKWSEEFRKARGDLSRAEASDVLGGCPVNTIRDWEQGLRTPPEWVQSLVIKRLKTITQNLPTKREGKGKMKTCDDCGSMVYNGHCVSCDEGYFIAKQETE